MNILEKLSSKKNIIYTAILFLFTLIIISPQIFFSIRDPSSATPGLNFLLTTSFLLVPLFVFYKNLKIYYFFIALYCSLTPILLLPTIMVNERISPEIISTAFHSNPHEIYELFGWKLLLLLVLIIVFFLGAWYLTTFLPKRIDFRTGIIMSIASLCFLCTTIYATGDTSIPYLSNVKLEMFKNYPFNLVLSTYSIIKTSHLEKEYLNNTANFTFGSYKTRQTDKRVIQVLVIGEASRYDHWGINGYYRNTSPFISNERNLISFSNVASGATLTITSVPFLITRLDVGSISNHLKEKSIMAAFKEAGFYTAWISNQNGTYENITDEFHTADCDTTIFTNVSGDGDDIFMTPNYDESVIEPFKKLIKNTSTDLFVVVHTMGSHWRYKYRYPKEYDIFRNADEKKSSNRINGLIDEYDNSILYSDHILKELINTLKDADAVTSLLYVSDHGENLKDNGGSLMYHSITPNFYTAHVPLFIWLSDDLRKQCPKIIQALTNNKDKPISTVQSVFYTTLDLGGINIGVDTNMERYSLTSFHYKSSDQKIEGESNVVYSFKDLKR